MVKTMTIDELINILKKEHEAYLSELTPMAKRIYSETMGQFMQALIKAITEHRPALEAEMQQPLRFAFDSDFEWSEGLNTERHGAWLLMQTRDLPATSIRGLIAFKTKQYCIGFADVLNLPAVFIDADGTGQPADPADGEEPCDD